MSLFRMFEYDIHDIVLLVTLGYAMYYVVMYIKCYVAQLRLVYTVMCHAVTTGYKCFVCSLSLAVLASTFDRIELTNSTRVKENVLEL